LLAEHNGVKCRREEKGNVLSFPMIMHVKGMGVKQSIFFYHKVK